MRIVLAALNAKYIHSSLALRYLQNACADLEVETILIEFTINDLPEQIAAEIYRHKPDLVAFSCYIWNIIPTLEVLSILHKVRPDLITVLGGPEVSFEPAELLADNPEIDIIVCGEGEVTWRELILTLLPEYRKGQKNFDPLINLPGLALRHGGKIYLTPPRPLISDLAALPSPYNLPGRPVQPPPDPGNRIVYYETSRGCPFSCSFCLSSLTPGVRYFPLERVKAEIAWLVESGVREIKFVDRTFNAHKKRALEIWEFLVTLPPRTKFYFEIVGDLLDEETLSFLATVPPGIFQFEIGVQSTNELANRLCQRKQNFDRLAAAVRQLKESGKIRLHLDLIAGLPQETYASFAASFDAVYNLRPDELQLGFLKLLKGTRLRAQAKEYGYIFMETPPYTVLASQTLSYDEMLRLHRIEDLVNKYANNHLADSAIEFFIREAFPGPFAFYEAFGDFWEKGQLHRHGHDYRGLYAILAEFAAALRPPARDIFLQLLKYEFLRRDRSRRWPAWVPPSNLSERERWLTLNKILEPDFRRRYLPGLTQVPAAELRRHGYLEMFPMHPAHPTQGEATLAFFYYGIPGSRSQAEVYFLPKNIK